MNQDVKYDAQRLAAAFGCKVFDTHPQNPLRYVGQCPTHTIIWDVSNTDNDIYVIGVYLHLDDDGGTAWVGQKTKESWSLSHWANPKQKDIFARGLFLFGFADENLLSRLPRLSAHEKIELCLNFPRHFWPRSWQGQIPIT